MKLSSWRENSHSTITGIIKNNPKNTEINCDLLIPFLFYKELGEDTESLGNNWITTYVQLSPGTVADTINNTIEALKKKNYPQAEAVFFLQPLRKIHLYSIWGGGPIKNVRLFSIIAALIILIAAINFTNLSTAMASKRHTEIGIKKSFGADRKTLVVQFLSETLLLSMISFFVALILTESFLPWYNTLLKTQLAIHYRDWKIMISFLAIMLVTGLLSGVYPALFLSSFKPVLILKSAFSSNKKSVLRETLVVLQFSLAIVLIVNTLIIKKQQNHMMKQDIGIQKENVIYIPVRGDLKTKYDLFKSQLLRDPSVKSVTLSSHLPTGIWSNGGGYKWQSKPAEVDPLVSNTTVDFDYANTLGIEMEEGEFYTENIYRDTAKVVINKTFADIIGIKPIIGEFIEKGDQQMQIIGVTENFNFKPLFSKIEPLVMYCIPDYHQYLLCKVSTENLPKTISKMQDLHNLLNGTFPFEYHFLDEDYDNLYNNETRQGRIFNIFSFLAIFISCLGLFGLASFMMVQRTKEIGIRKSNGALVLNIMTLFSKYYTRWVIVSFVIAAPVSYFMSKAWLKDYAYKTPISWWIFLLAGLIAFTIALLTVSWQSWRAASKNPVDALRYE